MKTPRMHFIPSVKIHSSDLICIWKLTFASEPIDRTWKGSHLVKGELRICKGCSDWSFPLPFHLLLQLLDLPHQSLLLGQELHKLFPEPKVILKCVLMVGAGVIGSMGDLYSSKRASNTASSNLPSWLRRIPSLSFIPISPLAWQNISHQSWSGYPLY